jgi:hypothetical protein
MSVYAQGASIRKRWPAQVRPLKENAKPRRRQEQVRGGALF